MRRPTLFETSHLAGQMRHFGLYETLSEAGWLKALRLDDYAARTAWRLDLLQQFLFAYTDAI